MKYLIETSRFSEGMEMIIGEKILSAINKHQPYGQIQTQTKFNAPMAI